MSEIFIVFIGLAIIWQGVDLVVRQRKIRADMRDLIKKNEDLNIEFGSREGDGIELVKKQYPDLELRDDHRTGLEEK